MTTASYATRNGVNTLDSLYYDTLGGTLIEERVGGSIAWDNFNPGNITYATSGPGSAAALGAIGKYADSNGITYAIFPSYLTGFNAIITLLESSLYEGAGLTTGSAVAKWSGATGTDLSFYQSTVDSAVGLPATTL